MRSRTRGLAPPLMCIALLSGCGSGGADGSFRAGYQSLRGPMNRTVASIKVALNEASSQTDAQVATAFRKIAGRWQGDLSRLQTLKAPAALSADFNTVTAAGARLETDLTAIVAAAATHNITAGRQAGASLGVDLDSLASATATLRHELGLGSQA